MYNIIISSHWLFVQIIRTAKKGIFITTGNFSREAKEYTHRIDSKIVLIDGKQLTEYMIDKNIGVTWEILFYKKIRPRLFWWNNRIKASILHKINSVLKL